MAKNFIVVILLVFSFGNSYALEKANSATFLRIHKISELTGQTGQYNSTNQTYKIIVPRNDLEISMRGIPVTPDMGLFSWVEFQKTDDVVRMKGDLLLLQDQVNPVMSVALNNGLQVTRLNNPYLWDSPRITVMHLKGLGNELQLARAVGLLLNKIKTTNNNDSSDFPLGSVGTSSLLKTTLSSHKIDSILGARGEFKDGVYKIRFSKKINTTNQEVDPEIMKNSWAIFSGSDNEAVINGSLVLQESELQKALLKLRQAKIYILAIYDHAVENSEGYVSVSFWGMSDTKTLARALRDVFVVAENHISTSPNLSPSVSVTPTVAVLNRPTIVLFNNNAIENNSNLKNTGELHLKIFALLGVAEVTAAEQIEKLENVFSYRIKKLPLAKADRVTIQLFTLRGLVQTRATEQIKALSSVFPLNINPLLFVEAIHSKLSILKNNIFSEKKEIKSWSTVFRNTSTHRFG